MAPRSPGPTEDATCRHYVVPRLESAGWTGSFVEQYAITDGRIVPSGAGHRRDPDRLIADYVLEHRPGFPVAVVEAKRAHRLPADGLQQAKRYAERLDVPLAYSTNGHGIVEHDYDTGQERELAAFPSRDEIWRRFQAWRGIGPEVGDALASPYNRSLHVAGGGVKEPRYYQRVAVTRALEAILSGQRRVLLTMATGTGKTFVALQLVWKFRNQREEADRQPRVLYLTDRKILADQPIANEFRPVFGEAIWKVEREPKYGREVYFALYQAIADSGENAGIFREYPPDFFDLVIVDECHRGSASAGSSWRSILEYFSPAVQVGMTATPLRNDNVDTYAYFGDPVYEYSLAQGIEDGFLAPYRVRRVVLSPDAHGWAPAAGQLDRLGHEIPVERYTTPDFERVVSLLPRTDAAARHLTDVLTRTDPMAKTIVFCVDQEHAEQMRMALSNANTDLVRRHPDYVTRVVSDEGGIGRSHLDRFVDPTTDTPVIVTTSQMLSTGIDAPLVRNVVLFKPIGSMTEFKQIIGRGTRLYPDEDKLSFEIIDYSGATTLFEDRAFDGPPESVTIEEVDDSGETVTQPVVEQSEPPFEREPSEGSVDDSRPVELRAHRKFYVDEGQAFVTAEGFYLPDGAGGSLRLVEYRDHVAHAVRSLSADPVQLRGRWQRPPARAEVLDALAARGIDVSEIAERLDLEDVDGLDLLVHVAWNEPVVSRRFRSERLRAEHREFFERFVPAARAVLDDLLDKYAEHGISQLDDLRVLGVPPLDRHGSVVEIAGHFGGQEDLRAAVSEMERLLYAA